MSNRDRITLRRLDSTPMLALARKGLAHHQRNDPICDLERGDGDRGWLIRTRGAGLFAMLTPGGAVQTLPQHKIAPAMKKAGIDV